MITLAFIMGALCGSLIGAGIVSSLKKSMPSSKTENKSEGYREAAERILEPPPLILKDEESLPAHKMAEKANSVQMRAKQRDMLKITWSFIQEKIKIAAAAGENNTVIFADYKETLERFIEPLQKEGYKVGMNHRGSSPHLYIDWG